MTALWRVDSVGSSPVPEGRSSAASKHNTYSKLYRYKTKMPPMRFKIMEPDILLWCRLSRKNLSWVPIKKKEPSSSMQCWLVRSQDMRWWC
jgi:hypothetical protein